MTTPVYICTGFLDSGKTTFIKDTLMKQEWIEEGPTLLLQCEEGEEEYSEKYLDENGLFLFNIEEREKLNIALINLDYNNSSEMIANKMTGAKGTQFTAAYVTVFNDMEKKQTEQEMFALPRNYKEALQQLIVQVDKNEELQRQNTALIHRIDQLEEKLELPTPKQEQKLYTASEIAAEYGMEAGELNLLLYSLHILKKEKGRLALPMMESR